MAKNKQKPEPEQDDKKLVELFSAKNSEKDDKIETPHVRLPEEKPNDEMIYVKQLIAEDDRKMAIDKFYTLQKDLSDFTMEIEQALIKGGDIVGTKYVLDKLVHIIEKNR